MKFSNFRLSIKLAIGFGAVLTIVAASSIFIYIQTLNLAEIERLNSVSGDAIDDLDKISSNLNSVRSNGRKYVLTGSAADKAKIDADLVKWSKNEAELKAILEHDAPQFLRDLDAFKSASAIFMDKAINVQIALASNVATRPQAVEMVSSNISAPFQMQSNRPSRRCAAS